MNVRDLSRDELTALVWKAVRDELAIKNRQVPVGISMRHIHLDRAALDALFGRNYQLTPLRALSQPGQFAAEEKLDVIGPRGTLRGVRILGPLRRAVQIELSQTDCRTVGLKAPVRSSGDTAGTPGVKLRGPLGELEVPEGVIVADRHIHLSPAQAQGFGLRDGDRVRVGIGGEKPGVMGGVLIRSNPQCDLDFHVDVDDGNAFQLRQGQFVTILGKEE